MKNEHHEHHEDHNDHVCCLNHEHDTHEPHNLCGHHHTNIEDSSGLRLLITLLLNLLIPSAQVIGGLYAGSVALISDAAHNFSDFTAILIAYVAYHIGKKGVSLTHTFGYKRSEVLAALINVAILMAASAFIVYEAIYRFRHPQPVSGYLVMWVAGIGVLGNGFSAWLLHRDAAHSLNVKGAFLHMVGDFLTSVVVLINGAVLIFKPWYWMDPLLSLLIVVFILKNCWTIFREASLILMNATPKGMDIVNIRDFLEQFPEVCGAHYLHVWNMSSSSVAFSAHIVVEDQLLSQTESLSEKIRRELLQHFGIDHAILQFETMTCGSGTVLCELSCDSKKTGT